MPTYRQAAFLPTALESLRAQTFRDWELIIVDDGSPDDTAQAAGRYLADPRVHYRRLQRNLGMGAALNCALDGASAPLVAYLPSDDLYYADHLASLVECLTAHPDAAIACSGVRHHYNRDAAARIEGYPIQLVQVMHRRTAERWPDRTELVTDDHGRMYWEKLQKHGRMLETRRVTCEWVSHPAQRHKLLREPEGGLNRYRARYNISHPMRFHSTVGHPVDEAAHYSRFRGSPRASHAPDALKILLVGELAYNPERVLALEERGHKLYGLWIPDPHWYNTVGPLPFGHVEDLPREGWRDAVRAVKPDIIYGLLNWQAVPLAHAVMSAGTGIPFVWHFKEAPFICHKVGTWPLLADLYRRADGLVHCSPEIRDWVSQMVPGAAHGPELVLDGDLPKREWFDAPLSERLSQTSGQIHTVVPGRPIGLHPPKVAELARNGIHLHFYGEYTHGQWLEWIETCRRLAPGYLHLHPNVPQGDWVNEFSQYDAGWLHDFSSANRGELRRCTWDDLNYPARIATLAAAGLPMIQRDNSGSIVAAQSLARRLGTGVFFTATEDLADQLRDAPRMQRLRNNVLAVRHELTFDSHAGRLIAFFREVMKAARGSSSRSPASNHALRGPAGRTRAIFDE